MKYIKATSALLIVIILMICLALPVLAISNPDSDPTISDIHTNTYLIESGDMAIYGQYDIPHGSIPTDDADETYLIRLIDTDNSSQLGCVVPFVKFDSGYNEGVFAFYFAAADAPTANQSYIIRITQNPAYFTSPQSWDYVIQSTDWTTETSQDDNRTEFRINIINIAEQLESAHSETLLESSVGGTVLADPAGEAYFRGAIYGIQAMCPALFLVQAITWDTTDRSWATTQFDSYGTRYTGTFIGTASDNTSATFGLETNVMMAAIFGLPIILGAVIVSTAKWRRQDPGYMVAMLVFICTALMGWLDPAVFALIFQLCAMYIGYLWFYARSGESFGSKMFSFLSFVWMMSTLICLFIEGSWVGSNEQTVINDLSAFTTLNIGGLVPIPAPNLYFFRGVSRVLLWDYSFYTGDFEVIRLIWLAIFTGAVGWGLLEKFAPVFANFLRIR